MLLITISPDASIAEAASLMLKHKIGGLPVVQQAPEGPILVGIITESDLFRLLIQSEVAKG